MMTNEQVQKIFNEAIAQTTNQERKAHLELAREYFIDPAFRCAMDNKVFQLGETS